MLSYRRVPLPAISPRCQPPQDGQAPREGSLTLTLTLALTLALALTLTLALALALALTLTQAPREGRRKFWDRF